MCEIFSIHERFSPWLEECLATIRITHRVASSINVTMSFSQFVQLLPDKLVKFKLLVGSLTDKSSKFCSMMLNFFLRSCSRARIFSLSTLDH